MPKSRAIIVFAFSVSIIVANARNALAITRFVNNQCAAGGTGLTESCSAGTDRPMSDIKACLQASQPGDTCEVFGTAGNPYHPDPTCNDHVPAYEPKVDGRADAPITLKAHAGQMPKLVGGPTANKTCPVDPKYGEPHWFGPVVGSGKDYFILDGFEIDGNVFIEGVQGYCSVSTSTLCRIDSDCRQFGGTETCVGGNPAVGNIVRNNNIYHGIGGWSDNGSLVQESNTLDFQLTNNHLHDCTFDTRNDPTDPRQFSRCDAWHSYSSTNTKATYNTLENLTFGGTLSQKANILNNTFAYNIIRNFSGSGYWTVNQSPPYRDYHIHHNLIVCNSGNDTEGIHFVFADTAEIYNNTIVNCNTGIHLEGHGGWKIWNNIFATLTGNSLWMSDAPNRPDFQDYDVFFPGGSRSEHFSDVGVDRTLAQWHATYPQYAANSFTDDCGFTADYHITNSRCKNAGRPGYPPGLGALPTDTSCVGYGCNGVGDALAPAAPKNLNAQ